MPQSDHLRPIGAEAYCILAQFYEYDRGVPLNVRTYDRERDGDFIREKIVFRGVSNNQVAAYLGMPATAPPPYGCVMLLHGLGASKDDWWTESSVDDQLRRELHAAGFAVLALDIPFHGERSQDNDYESAWSMVVDHGQVNKYREMLAQSVLEHRRAIDLLAARPEIDVARLGMLGRSIGGLVTYILAAVEPRLKSAVACATCPMSDYYVRCVGWDETAKQRLAPVAPRNFAPRITSTPFLMLHGKDDQYGTVEGIRALHDLVASPTKALVFFESGHRLPPAFVPHAVACLRQHLVHEHAEPTSPRRQSSGATRLPMRAGGPLALSHDL
jgi:pimeloyl-ACP methyl ester carboxylesterase